jgi:flagellar hook protein FlgE
MTISSLSNAASGMHRAGHQLEQSASRIARIGMEGNDVNVSAEMINVIQAKHDFKASAKVASVASDMTKALLDILV